MTGYFIFDDIDTRDFEDIYVYFDKVDETPKRVYTKVDIPARNGAFYIDENRYEDVEHVYHIAALTKEAGSALINALASKIGYYRLEDSFNPTEYYQAVFTSGAEPKISSTRDKNTFKVTFTRKPQRWLKSGETAVTVASGDTLTNPTLFESSPLLEIDGVGDIEFNGYTVSIESSDTGEVVVPYTQSEANFTLDLSQFNTGDTFTISGMYIVSTRNYINVASIHSYGRVSALLPSGWIATRGFDASRLRTYVNLPDITLTLGTAYTSSTAEVVNRASGVKTSDSTAVSWNTTDRVKFSYDGINTLTLSITRLETLSPRSASTSRNVGNITGYSTKPYDYGTIYCDTDIGEFYRIEGEEIISMNHVGDLGTDLPKLASGENEITFDNTITQLDVTPRWWKI